MAALSEKVLWPVVAILIFGVLVGFYIDDRRRLIADDGSASEHSGQAAENKTTGHKTERKQASNEHAGEAATSKEHGGKAAEKSSANTSQSQQTASTTAAGATSMSLDEYLAGSANERSAELEANVAHHQGFSGSIDEYLSGKSKASKNAQADTSKQAKQSKQASGATSMSMEEYQAQANGKASGKSNRTSQQASSNASAYHGDMDGYLAKYGKDNQTAISNSNEKPFNQKEHMGFHGSYEEYAKKYN